MYTDLCIHRGLREMCLFIYKRESLYIKRRIPLYTETYPSIYTDLYRQRQRPLNAEICLLRSLLMQKCIPPWQFVTVPTQNARSLQSIVRYQYRAIFKHALRDSNIKLVFVPRDTDISVSYKFQFGIWYKFQFGIWYKFQFGIWYKFQFGIFAVQIPNWYLNHAVRVWTSDDSLSWRHIIDTWHFPLKMPHPRELRFLGISRYKFKLRFLFIWICTKEFEFLV